MSTTRHSTGGGEVAGDVGRYGTKLAGMCSTLKDAINAELPSFLKGTRKAAA
jgi:hypothetical protein